MKLRSSWIPFPFQNYPSIWWSFSNKLQVARTMFQHMQSVECMNYDSHGSSPVSPSPASASSASSSSSQESLGLPQSRYVNRRVLRAAESVDELDALGFAGVPRRYATRSNSSESTDSSFSSSSAGSLPLSPPPPFPAPPSYCQFESPEHHLGFSGVRTFGEANADRVASNDVIMTTNGDVIKAKLRYKMHKLKAGKHAEEWHVFLNKSLKPGEAPWAPLGSILWKVPRYELGQSSGSSSGSEDDMSEEPSPISSERRSSV